MKKLKLQKALLAICLALPITLTKNHAISAMETNIEISANKADDKEANAQQKLQEQLEQIANQPTHTAALQYYIDITHPKTLGEEEYKQFLTYYIKNNIVNYLALIIQAKNNLIQFPNNTSSDTTLTSDTIYHMLITNEPNTPNPIYSNAYSIQRDLIQKIQQYLSKLDKEQIVELTAAENILKEIFTKVDPDKNSYTITKLFNGIRNSLWGWIGNKTEETNKLTALIDNYIQQPEKGQKQTPPEHPSRLILASMGGIAKQLHKEAAAFDDKHGEQKQKLTDIAQQIQRVFDAYKDKQTEKEEEKKESELNISNLSSKSQKIDDIQIEDYKEENKNTSNNGELGKNEEEEQKSNKDEAENKEEIINNSKKEEIEVTEQEEEEEKIDKQNNSIINTPLSVISEEKKVDNDKENKEEVESPKGKSKEPEIKAEQDEHKKEGKDTQKENKKSYDTDIKQIEQLINKWQQKKKEINKDKEGKLKQLEKDIEDLEQKYKQIVRGDEEDEESML